MREVHKELRKPQLQHNEEDSGTPYYIDAQRQYLADANAYDFLTKEQEMQLAQTIEKARIANTIVHLARLSNLESSRLPLVGEESRARILKQDALRYIKEVGLSEDTISLVVSVDSETPEQNIDSNAPDQEIFAFEDNSNPTEEQEALQPDNEMGIKNSQQLLAKLNRDVLAKAIKEGERAREDFINSNLKLVVSRAKRKFGFWPGIDRLDLIQEGNLALMTAVDKFEWRRGNKFSTVATWWIDTAIDRAIKNQGFTISLPIQVHEDINKVIGMWGKLIQSNDSEPTPDQMATALEWPIERVELSLNGMGIQKIHSINVPLSIKGDRKKKTLADFLPTNDKSPEEEALEREVKERVSNEIKGRVNPREARVLRLHFGLEDERERTQEDIGKEFGVTRVRIRQIEKKALGKLRNPQTLKALEDFKT